MTLKDPNRTLNIDESRRLKAIIDELDEQIDTRKELIHMVGREACIEFLEEQMHHYRDDEKDQLYRDMQRLLQILHADDTRHMKFLTKSRKLSDDRKCS